MNKITIEHSGKKDCGVLHTIKGKVDGDTVFAVSLYDDGKWGISHSQGLVDLSRIDIQLETIQKVLAEMEVIR